MPAEQRFQVPGRDLIIERALGAGVPEDLARYLGRAGGESRLAYEIYGTANHLAADYVSDKQRAEGIGAASLPETLLEHFPGIVVALVAEESDQEKVLYLWETRLDQKQWLQTVSERA